MKQKDIALYVVIGIFSTIAALLVSNLFIQPPESQNTEVEVVEPISDEFPPPSSQYFNDKSINPTKIIEIEDNKNDTPFDN